MSSLSGRLLECGECAYWLRNWKDVGVCKWPESSHYQHLITKTHPACEYFKIQDDPTPKEGD